MLHTGQELQNVTKAQSCKRAPAMGHEAVPGGPCVPWTKGIWGSSHRCTGIWRCCVTARVAKNTAQSKAPLHLPGDNRLGSARCQELQSSQGVHRDSGPVPPYPPTASPCAAILAGRGCSLNSAGQADPSAPSHSRLTHGRQHSLVRLPAPMCANQPYSSLGFTSPLLPQPRYTLERGQHRCHSCDSPATCGKRSVPLHLFFCWKPFSITIFTVLGDKVKAGGMYSSFFGIKKNISLNPE